jgi:hypothetical protein
MQSDRLDAIWRSGFPRKSVTTHTGLALFTGLAGREPPNQSIGLCSSYSRFSRPSGSRLGPSGCAPDFAAVLDDAQFECEHRFSLGARGIEPVLIICRSVEARRSRCSQSAAHVQARAEVHPHGRRTDCTSMRLRANGDSEQIDLI